MAHRDDREADRAKIDALEDEVAELRARAEKAEAAAARASVAKASAPSPDRRAEPVRERKAGKGPPAERPGEWPVAKRKAFFRPAIVAALAAYAPVAGIALFGGTTDAVFDIGLLTALVMLLVVAFVRGVAAWATDAPGVFNAAIITLLDAPMALGAIALFASDMLWEDWLPAVLFFPARAVGVLGAWIGGAFAGAHWATEAASSESTGAD